MAARVVLLLAVLLLVPVASACSTGPSLRAPAPPGVFFLYDPWNDTHTDVRVDRPMTGGGCQLSNAFAAGDAGFAWYEEDPEEGIIHVLRDGNVTHLTFDEARERPDHLAWMGDDLLASTRRGELWRIDDGGAIQRFSDAEVSGTGTQYGMFFANRDREGVTSVYNLATANWVVKGLQPQEQSRLAGVDDRFVVFISQAYSSPGYQQTVRFFDTHLDSWRTHQLPGRSHSVMAADGEVYAKFDNGTFYAADLLTGANVTREGVPAGLLGAGGGVVVLGATSAALIEGPWRPEYARMKIPAVGWPIVLVAIALLRPRPNR